jgi:hypothetical protein
MVIFFEDRNFAYISGWSFANESVSNLDSFFANLFQETTPFISSSFMEKGKSLPSPELIVKLAQALEADVDEMSHRADHVAPEVVGVIQNQPKAVPNFLRSAKDLTPEQWAQLQKQVEEMAGDKNADDS